MMCFDSLRVMKLRPQKKSETARLAPIAGSLLMIVVSSCVSAQELLEEIELPKPAVLKSGVPIPDLGTATRQAIVIDSEAPSSRDNYTGVRTYQLGSSVVKEYRYGQQLHHIEIVSTQGSTYVVEQRHSYRGEDQNRRSRSGIVVSTW